MQSVAKDIKLGAGVFIDDYIPKLANEDHAYITHVQYKQK